MKSLEDLRLDDFRLELKGRSLVPIMQGGMGVNISTAEMAQAYGLVDKVLASRRDLLAEKSE